MNRLKIFAAMIVMAVSASISAHADDPDYDLIFAKGRQFQQKMAQVNGLIQEVPDSYSHRDRLADYLVKISQELHQLGMRLRQGDSQRANMLQNADRLEDLSGDLRRWAFRLKLAAGWHGDDDTRDLAQQIVIRAHQMKSLADDIEDELE